MQLIFSEKDTVVLQQEWSGTPTVPRRCDTVRLFRPDSGHLADYKVEGVLWDYSSSPTTIHVEVEFMRELSVVAEKVTEKVGILLP